MNLDSRLKCKCGKKRDLFQLLIDLGYKRERLVANLNAFQDDVIELLPRLRCSKCKKKGLVELIENKPQQKQYLVNPKSKVPFSQRLVATDRGVKRVFHKQTCGYAKTIRREDEIFFDTREEAIKRLFDPCKSCRP
jgi:hypothetical protein